MILPATSVALAPITTAVALSKPAGMNMPLHQRKLPTTANGTFDQEHYQHCQGRPVISPLPLFVLSTSLPANVFRLSSAAARTQAAGSTTALMFPLSKTLEELHRHIILLAGEPLVDIEDS